jgi:hypothetical protein
LPVYREGGAVMGWLSDPAADRAKRAPGLGPAPSTQGRVEVPASARERLRRLRERAAGRQRAADQRPDTPEEAAARADEHDGLRRLQFMTSVWVDDEN